MPTGTSPTRNYRVEIALFVGLFLWVLRPIWSIDVFFHVAIGREIVENGIPSMDVFSAAHPDAPWTPFQVGYALLVHALDSLGGLDLLRVSHAALLASAIVFLWRLVRDSTSSPWGAVLLLSLFLLLYEERVRLRPHLFNLLFEVTIVLPLALGSWRANPKHWRIIILLGSLAWTFMHAMGSLWLVCVAGTIAVAGSDASERRFGWTVVTLAVVGVLTSPGAVGGILHVLSISGDWAAFVPELAPSWTWFQYESPYGLVAGTLPWLALALVIASCLRQPPRSQWPTILAAAGLAFGAVWMVRLTYYSVFVFILLQRDIQHFWDLFASRSERLLRVRNTFIAGAILLVLTVLAWQRVPPTVRRDVNPWTTTLDPGAFPEAEVKLLKAAGIGTRIFNHTVWGGFILYHMYPQARVLSDGRITFLNDVKDTLYHIRRRSRRVKTLMWTRANWKIDLVVWPRGMMPENSMWERLIVGPTAEVWAPRGPIAKTYRQALQKVDSYPP